MVFVTDLFGGYSAVFESTTFSKTKVADQLMSYLFKLIEKLV
jgi:hypothetical protein